MPGGRPKGSPNKRTQEIAERLSELKCDPIEAMVKIAMDVANDVKLRAEMYKELAQYLYPKRKAIEHSGEITTPYVAMMPPMAEDSDGWAKQHAPKTLQ